MDCSTAQCKHRNVLNRGTIQGSRFFLFLAILVSDIMLLTLCSHSALCQLSAELCPLWIATNVYRLKCLLVTKQRCVENTDQRSCGSSNILINLGKLNLGFIWFLVPGSGDECRVEDDTCKICGACGSMHCNGTLYHLQQICEAASCAASKRAVW